ncbi:MAG TPA: HNH endonuclease, partial [Ignavibacteriaceae bacterium]|nr:HNH endonuclease [Ignavibacteriaceae bacterium]
MSYESEMLKSHKMPIRKKVEESILITLFKHNGAIKEFAYGEEIVEELADFFKLTHEQRNAYLTTIYKKENRLKKSYLWHRLLFRAADSLANEKMITRPSETFLLTNKREWMLTEKGFDFALRLLSIPKSRKNLLTTKSYEVQKVIKKLEVKERPIVYTPFNQEKKTQKITREYDIRIRGFRLAVIEAYDYKCAFCGMKINSPDSLIWEVEAAHIVPHRLKGKDDIWNGLALCHLHHWAFDVGWFTILDNYEIKLSSQIDVLPVDYGKTGDYHFLRSFIKEGAYIYLPENKKIYPHKNSLCWHRENI